MAKQSTIFVLKAHSVIVCVCVCVAGGGCQRAPPYTLYEVETAIYVPPFT